MRVETSINKFIGSWRIFCILIQFVSAEVKFEAVDRDIEKLFGCEDERDIEYQPPSPVLSLSKLTTKQHLLKFMACYNNINVYVVILRIFYFVLLNKFADGSDMSYQKACQILCQAAMKDKWRLVEPILKEKSSFIHEEISKQGT